MIVNYFPTRLYQYENIFDTTILNNVLNAIKNDSGHLAEVSQDNPRGGPEYKTNYNYTTLHQHLFDPIFDILNEHLALDDAHFQHMLPPWYAEYGEHDSQGPHIHDLHQVDLIKLNKSYKYSIIIHLSNIGATFFRNHNSSSLDGPTTMISSSYGKTILFPSNVWHWVEPHRIRGRKRAIFSTNGILTVGQK